MGNASSHPSNGPTSDVQSGSHAAPIPSSGRERGDRDRTTRSERERDRDRERDAPALPPSPPPPPTPLLLPYAGHLSPQNPHCLSHPQVHDYSKTVVTTLILDNQLAPFYRGLDDFEEDWTEEDIRTALDEARDKDYAEDVKNSYTQRLKEERESGKKYGTPEEKAERARREAKAYLGAVECPICFLNYPPNINTSRCCQQPLCTECFVQIKRGEATTTHLESEPACCPYCVESDFGVIYERPTPAPSPTPVSPAGSGPGLEGVPQHALASSPEAGMSGFSAALSLSDEPGTNTLGVPISKSSTPTPRRKSVSHKAKEVITIDQIRPDWEAKLNAVKAAAARRAARRIVMRQVGDRLIPIGYTSSRATGQADFSMSLPPEEGRRSRRTRERERELEEMMIMEAMRLSMIDHEEHQRKLADEDKAKVAAAAAGNGKQPSAVSGAGASAGPSQAGSSLQPGPSSQAGPSQGQGRGTGSSTPSSSRRSSSAGQTMGSWRAAQANESGGRAQAAASKLLSKITVNRSRANSKSSVHFAPSPTTLGVGSGSPANSHPPSVHGTEPNRNRSSSTPSPNPILQQQHAPTHSPLAGDATETPNETTTASPSTDVPTIVTSTDAPDTTTADEDVPAIEPIAESTTAAELVAQPVAAPVTAAEPLTAVSKPTTDAPSLAPAPAFLENSAPMESPEVYMDDVTPPAAPPTTDSLFPTDTDPAETGTPTPTTSQLPEVPTAANPHPKLAALMAEAAVDEPRYKSAVPTTIPESVSQSTSTSDLVSSSSLASTPPTAKSRPEVPLSAMVDESD